MSLKKKLRKKQKKQQPKISFTNQVARRFLSNLYEDDSKVVKKMQYPIEEQIAHLGRSLDSLILKSRISQNPFKILDLGCGFDALFFQYLNNHNLHAEGIDTYLDDSLVKLHNGKLMRQEIKPNSNSIQRPNENYQMIIAHMNSTLYFNSSYYITFFENNFDEFGNQKRKSIQYELKKIIQDKSTGVITEALRVLDKNTGELVCFPSIELQYFPKNFVDDIKNLGFGIRTEEYCGKPKVINHVPSFFSELWGNVCKYRTVFFAKKS